MNDGLALGFGLALCACVDTTPKPTPPPVFYANNVKGYAETVSGLPPEEVLGCELLVEGGTARWNECTAVDACSDVQRSRPARELLAVRQVGETEREGRRLAVVRLSLEPRPGYVVPSFKPPVR